MKIRIWCVIATVGLLLGCSSMRSHMGGSAENDQNVLTGGPVTGTTIYDLPQPVRDTLKQRTPKAEIADIDKQTPGGRVIYRISFSEPTRNPTLYIAADGTIVQNMQEKSHAESEGK